MSMMKSATDAVARLERQSLLLVGAGEETRRWLPEETEQQYACSFSSDLSIARALLLKQKDALVIFMPGVSVEAECQDFFRRMPTATLLLVSDDAEWAWEHEQVAEVVQVEASIAEKKAALRRAVRWSRRQKSQALIEQELDERKSARNALYHTFNALHRFDSPSDGDLTFFLEKLGHHLLESLELMCVHFSLMTHDEQAVDVIAGWPSLPWLDDLESTPSQTLMSDGKPLYIPDWRLRKLCDAPFLEEHALSNEVFFSIAPLENAGHQVRGYVEFFYKRKSPVRRLTLEEGMFVARKIGYMITSLNYELQLQESRLDHREIADFNTRLLADFRIQEVQEMELYRRTLDQLLSAEPGDQRPTHALIVRREGPNLIRALPFGRKANGKVVVLAPALSSRSLVEIFPAKQATQIFNRPPYASDLLNQPPPSFPESLYRLFGEIHNFVYCPLHPVKGSLGSVVLFNYGRPVRRTDASILRSYAVPLGFQIGIAREVQERQQTQLVTMAKLAELAEKRDYETGAHLRRISHYCRVLAEDLAAPYSAYAEQIDARFVRQIFESSPLHDIGKVGIADEVLLKPGPLTEEEYAIMKTHTLIGAEVLKGIGFLEMAYDIALCHHEKFDGTGYPNQLRGREIPLPARIVALADVYDAVTSKRVYRPKPFTHEEARDFILGQYNKHFDPVIVDAFVRCEALFKELRETYRY